MKYVGLLFVLLAPSALGFMKAQEYIEKRNVLRGFISLIELIKREVSSYLTPQQEIYDKFYDKYLDKTSFIKALQKSGSDTPFASALSEAKTKLPLKEDTFDLLYDFALHFGTLSEGEECKRCDKLINELEEIYKAQKEETSEKVRLCRMVGCMVGITLALLLW